MTTKDGQVVLEPQVFGSSWRVGGKNACSRPLKPAFVQTSTQCSKKGPRIRERMCKPLRQRMFAACHKKLNPVNFFRLVHYNTLVLNAASCRFEIPAQSPFFWCINIMYTYVHAYRLNHKFALFAHVYYRSCLMDMCECPTGRKCYCEAMTAYAHNCRRLGVSLPDWRTMTGCHIY